MTSSLTISRAADLGVIYGHGTGQHGQLRRLSFEPNSCAYRDLLPPDRFSQLAVAAAYHSLSGTPYAGDGPHDDLGLILNTTFNTRTAVEASFEELRIHGPRGVSPTRFPSATSAVTIGHVARAFQITGCVTVLNATSPFRLAASWLCRARARAVLVLAVEETSPALLAAYDSNPDGPHLFEEAAVGLLCVPPVSNDSPNAGRCVSVRGWATSVAPQDIVAPWAHPRARTALSESTIGALRDASLNASDLTAMSAPSAAWGGSETATPDDDCERLPETFSANELSALAGLVNEGPPGMQVVHSMQAGAAFTSLIVEVR